jgi:hypothetical protein
MERWAAGREGRKLEDPQTHTKPLAAVYIKGIS